ncbi:MAG: ABC transporter substrate-binding protein [Acidimicrobiia bacterium]|nr:ABC transporter substrate-binding protein [Acidimicrobiia bacterium]
MTGSRLVRRWAAVLVTISLACATSASLAGAGEKFPAVDQPGVTDTEIAVGGVLTDTMNPTGVSYGPAFDGVEAYFEYINKSEGGVYGRKLVLSSKRDDQLGKNRAESQALISEDNVFAALPLATSLFTGAQVYVDEGIPTFGWDINAEFGSENNTPGPPNLFGAQGSYICFTCAQAGINQWLPTKIGVKNVALLAYNVVQSTDCALGAKSSFEKYKTAKVAFDDESLGFGNPDFSAQVSQMVDAKVDYIIACIDFNGIINLRKEMLRQGLEAAMVLPNAYEHETIKENQQFLNGLYVATLFAPFEAKPQRPAVKLFLKWMKKTGGRQTENAIIGWINADEFVTGLKAAGPNFTRQKVIDALNQITDYTANGFVPPIDWTKAHEDDQDCTALMKIVKGKLKPVYGKPGKPFLCFGDDLAKIPKNPEVK